MLLIASTFISGCSQDIPAVNCQEPNIECYIQQSLKNIAIAKENVGYWSTINLIGQILAIFFGIIATLMIALQGDANKRWTRPVGIVATTLVTGISTVLGNFHVPENVDKSIEITGKMVKFTNDFIGKIEKLKAGKTQEEVNEAYKTNAEFRENFNALAAEFSENENNIKMEMWRIKGSAARLNAGSAEPSQQKQPR